MRVWKVIGLTYWLTFTESWRPCKLFGCCSLCWYIVLRNCFFLEKLLSESMYSTRKVRICSLVTSILYVMVVYYDIINNTFFLINISVIFIISIILHINYNFNRFSKDFPSFPKAMALSGAVVQRPKLQAPTPVKRWVVGCYQSCSNQVLHVITQSERLKPEIGMHWFFLCLESTVLEFFGKYQVSRDFVLGWECMV